MSEIIESDKIEKMIYEVNGVEVMLDSDLANIYFVETKRINEAVHRNKEKFPDRFTWILSQEELDILWSQNATANISNKSRRNPRVFTEQGIYMLGTILKSDIAIKVSIVIMDTFVKMRHYINYNNTLLPNKIFLIENKVDENTKRINQLFDMFDSKDIAKEYLFFENEFFDSNYILLKIFESAKSSITIIDNYAGKELLNILKDINKKITIISSNIDDKNIKNYKKQYNNVEFITNTSFHDRFVIIDNKNIYHCGASFKDLGKRCFAINKFDDQYTINSLIEYITNIQK